MITQDDKAHRAGLRFAKRYVAGLSTAKRAKQRVMGIEVQINNHTVEANLDGASVSRIPTGWSEVTLSFTVYEKPARAPA